MDQFGYVSINWLVSVSQFSETLVQSASSRFPKSGSKETGTIGEKNISEQPLTAPTAV